MSGIDLNGLRPSGLTPATWQGIISWEAALPENELLGELSPIEIKQLYIEKGPHIVADILSTEPARLKHLTKYLTPLQKKEVNKDIVIPKIKGAEVDFIHPAQRNTILKRANTVDIKMGEYAISKGDVDLFSTGAGPCVLLVIMDRENNLYALAHLHGSQDFQGSVQTLVKEMIDQGAKRENLIAITGAGDTKKFSQNPRSLAKAVRREAIPIRKTLWNLTMGEFLINRQGELYFGKMGAFRLTGQQNQEGSQRRKVLPQIKLSYLP
ncbi:hypothetical protein A2291_05220 [candidate division WOR-1 bacterium RIFOXYB2_FULL_42_35]|uniref:Uncharacterized protein n=1 Tax=candidate division WOR-1 bacterium RIFOXYC2_FULL_41_25 TaxID=1802586 RepID=A0A1F4TN39_UNCSA|nr:MAG: hypothetical protein A2247_00640 [candidate division WOR-1 bacterium RIFOXYA2_FULL_41_14]OGC24501.1 MAG: hypothetical protein A2291_05220 [candidate division WOR-1 bacterium RIFOXYB2_FULL_42_35]OGC34118.1 MAG: hypothetical protein A2462_01080 [candidate division WOR-1 bacterium RIFOXYC2_FULL_41_25]OGC42812.1 MAG: hypothetical protein A2548_00700 [candidate division WOR-1 bacterium RIFOXYD2_FULL_41_8]